MATKRTTQKHIAPMPRRARPDARRASRRRIGETGTPTPRTRVGGRKVPPQAVTRRSRTGVEGWQEPGDPNVGGRVPARRRGAGRPRDSGPEDKLEVELQRQEDEEL